MGIVKSLFSIFKVNRRNWKAIILSMLAAMVFWFLNALNKQYTTNISFPLTFDYDAKFYVPVEPLPNNIQINVTGLGWDLLRRSTGFNVPPLVIPLERPSDVRKIVGETLPVLFSDQMNALQINYVLADTLNIRFEQKISRWLTLTVDSVERRLDPDFGLVGPVSIIPDSILLEGPIRTVSELKEPYPIFLQETGIDESIDRFIEVRTPNNELVIKKPERVRVVINVEHFVELTDSVLLSFLNPPTQWQLRLERSKIPVTLRMKEAIRDTFAWDSLQAVVDLKGFKRGKHTILPSIQELPSEVTVVSVDSLHITY